MKSEGDDGRRRRVAPAAATEGLAALSLALVGSLVVLSTAVIAPSLPAIEAHFYDDPRAGYLVPLLVTAPALVIAIAAPFAGYVLDRFGRHRAVLAALVGFVVFGAAGVVGEGLDWLLWTRAGLGLCVAFLTAGFTSLVGDLFAPDQRAALLARQMGLNSIMALTMTIAGGVLAEWHWRGMFLIYLVALPLVFMFARFVPAVPARPAPRPDDPAPTDPLSAPLLAIAAIYGLAVLCTLFSMLAPTRTPFLLQERYGASPSVIALAMSAFTLGVLPASMVFARLRARLSAGPLFALGFAVMAAGFALQSLVPAFAAVVVSMGVIGFGFGLLMPNLSTTLLGVAPAPLRGRLSGGLASAIFLGQFLSPLFSQPLVDRVGIETSFLVAAAMMVAVALACLLGAPARRRE